MWRCIFFVIGCCSCSTPKQDSIHQHRFEASVFRSEYGGFGYDIRQGDKLIIHQPSIPAIAGNRGFATDQGARKIAALVITKLEKGLMPPTLTPDEVNATLQRDVPWNTLSVSDAEVNKLYEQNILP
jgi:hypothetical protein